jgi:membrane protein DedA with SNARE-associated domain
MLIALTPLLSVLGPAALLVAMAIVFAETGLLLGFFLPGDSLLFTLGLLSAAGAIHLPVWVIVVGVFVACVAGDQVGYLLGRRFGPRVFNRESSRWFRASHAERARVFFDRHGAKAIVLARFVPVVRTFTPVVAGVAGMPRRRFTAFNVGGGFLWSVLLVAAGYFLGGIPIVAAHVELIVVGLVLLSVVPAMIAYLRTRRTTQDPGPSESDPSSRQAVEATADRLAA